MPALSRTLVSILVAAVLAGVAAAPAQAGGIFRYGDALSYASVLPEERNDVTVSLTSDGRLRFHDRRFVIVFVESGETAAPCAYEADPHVVTCDATGIRVVSVTGGAHDDRLVVDAPLIALICGGLGDDAIRGGPADDNLIGGGGRDRVAGGGGKDMLRVRGAGCNPSGTQPAVAVFDGGAGDDAVLGGPLADRLAGGPGEDSLLGLGGRDRAQGGRGDDLLQGGTSADRLRGGAGKDGLCGGPGDDRLLGGTGSDNVGYSIRYRTDANAPIVTETELGDDLLAGQGGDDNLAAGPNRGGFGFVDPFDELPELFGDPRRPNGADTFRGGSGTDTVSYELRAAPVTVTIDRRRDDGARRERDRVAADVERVVGGSRGDRLVGNGDADVLDGGPGPDTLVGAGGRDELSGGIEDDARDRLDGGNGDDDLDGGPGDDRLDDGAGGDDVAGAGGDDELRAGTGADRFDAGSGRDLLAYDGARGRVRVILDSDRNDGESGEDLVRGVEDVRGGPGDDLLIGDGAPNALDGADGDDTIEGRAGRDELAGGAGRDRVRARDGERDRVDCGDGADVAALDVVDTGPRECERRSGGR